MDKIAYFIVNGVPHGKQRPRLALRGKKTFCYTPKPTVEYEKKVANSYREFYGKSMFKADIPLKVIIQAYYPIPSSASKKLKKKMINSEVLPTVTPDADNVIKSILDGLNGVAYPDDRQIVEITFVSSYATEEPHVRVYIFGTLEVF